MQHKTIFSILFLTLLLSACQADRLNELTQTSADQQELESRKSFPDLIPLPVGFQPEGIVAGTGNDFYVGSLANGAIYRGDFRSGSGEIFFTPEEPRVAVGLFFDSGTQYLYVAGGPSGNAYVIDTRTGMEVMAFEFGGGFINDVVVTKDAAYFTDSFAPVIYKVSIDPNGNLPETADFEALPLSGDFVSVGGFNANGIETTPEGTSLIVVNSGTGKLYLVDPNTGEAVEIDLGLDSVISGDGILLSGKTLYVVQNFLNEIAVISLAPDYLTGGKTDVLFDDDFQIPTTVTLHGNTLYAVNARFDSPTPESIEYDVVKVGE